MKTTAAIIIIILSFMLTACDGQDAAEDNKIQPRVHMLLSASCEDCAEMEAFLETLQADHPFIIVEYDIAKDLDAWNQVASTFTAAPSSVPMAIIGEKMFYGFYDEQGEEEFSQSKKAFKGYKNQIEDAVMLLV